MRKSISKTFETDDTDEVMNKMHLSSLPRDLLVLSCILFPSRGRFGFPLTARLAMHLVHWWCKSFFFLCLVFWALAAAGFDFLRNSCNHEGWAHGPLGSTEYLGALLFHQPALFSIFWSHELLPAYY
jgi:hypothetical protein